MKTKYKNYDYLGRSIPIPQKPNNSNESWRDRFISLLIGMRLSKKQKLEIDRFISSELQREREKVLEEVRIEISNYFGHILNDGNGKPMYVTSEEIGLDLVELLSKLKDLQGGQHIRR